MVRIYFTTVVRAAPLRAGGELVCLDWDRKRVLGRVPMFASDPDPVDPNERGGARGGRGIALVGDEVVAADYHTLNVFDRELNRRRKLSCGVLLDIHEVDHEDDGTLWVASTGLDGAVQVDLRTGAPLRAHWPRQGGALSEHFGLRPLGVDLEADQRTNVALMAGNPYADASHLHLNAVRRWRGQTLAVFHHLGAIVNLDEGRVVVQEPDLKGAHNLLIDEQGTAIVNDTKRRAVLLYDLVAGLRTGRIDLGSLPQVQALARRHWTYLAYRGSRLATRLRERTGLRLQRKPFPAAPLFLRGMDRVGDRLFVGFSPASIVCLDWRQGKVLETYTYSGDLRAAVHGLKVAVD